MVFVLFLTSDRMEHHLYSEKYSGLELPEHLQIDVKVPPFSAHMHCGPALKLTRWAVILMLSACTFISEIVSEKNLHLEI